MVQPAISQYIFSTLLQFLLLPLNILLTVLFLTSRFLAIWYNNFESIQSLLLHEAMNVVRCFKTLRDCMFPERFVEGSDLPTRYGTPCR